MYLSTYLVTPLLCGLLASGAVIHSVAPRADQSLFARMAVSGIDMTQDQKPCGPNQTVLTCAKNVARTWQIPRSAQGQPQPMKIKISNKAFGLYIKPLVYIEASECVLSNPILTSMGDTVSCSIDSCTESFTFTTTTTETKTFGFTTALTLSVAAEQSVPFIGTKFTTTVSTTQTANWQDTSSVATTTTTTKTWTMDNGENCSPTTIQYQVMCRTKIRLAFDETSWPVYSAGVFRLGSQKAGCDMNEMTRAALGMSDEGGDMFSQFCKAVTSDGHVTTIDVGMPGSSGRAWSMDGCMWPVPQNDPQ